MLKTNYEIEVIVHGSPAKEYLHDNKYYIEGREGSAFSIRMKNNSGQRALFIPTVDGLSVMNGKEASFKSRGYIIDAYQSVTIDGWRTSDDKIAEFFFSSASQSYANKMGKAGNLGVIGCAVFKEKPTTRDPEWLMCNGTGIASLGKMDLSGSDNTIMLCASQLDYSGTTTTTKGLGTGFGQEKYSPVIKVQFEKEDYPVATFSIYYNTRENLKAMGVEFKKPLYVTPSAFPNEDGYCEKPSLKQII